MTERNIYSLFDENNTKQNKKHVDKHTFCDHGASITFGIYELDNHVILEYVKAKHNQLVIKMKNTVPSQVIINFRPSILSTYQNVSAYNSIALIFPPNYYNIYMGLLVRKNFL